MDSTTSQRLPEACSYPAVCIDRASVMIAWLVTILVSAAPDIIWVRAFGEVPPWLSFAKMGLLAALGLGAVRWKTLQPLRNYFVVMFAMLGLLALRPAINFNLTGLQHVFGGSFFEARMQAEQLGKLAVALGIMALLLVLGYRRRDFFLTRGHLRAPIEPVPLLGFPKADPWPWFGLQWGLYIAAALAIVQYLGLRPSGELMLKVVPVLPAILFYAALNAFNEEMTYRAPMLTTLGPVGGSRHALWMSAYFFGIAHYFGTPGGLVGGIASIFMGWILGKAMVETRGLFWSWWIHFLSDIVIFVFLAMALLK